MSNLQHLIERMLEDKLTASESRQLEALLKSDPSARREYAEQCLLHARFLTDPDTRESLKADAPIDQPESEFVPAETEANAASRSWLSYFSTIGTSVAISVAAVAVYLNLSRTEPTEFSSEYPPAHDTPQDVYSKTVFPESGSLKRPPTNFATVSAPGSADAVSFNRDIRPILSENCYHCHGPDSGTRKAELRLDIEAYAFVPHGKFDAPIVKGNPDKSPLYKRIMSPLKSEVMPPPDSHKTLTAKQKDLIRQWIVQGANWEAHWAFIKPAKTEPARSDWGNGPIDSFVRAKHKELKLSPNPPADRATLIRRLSLDLTGLPATPEETARFVADASPDAYQKAVERLLASPAYGEHQARYWLDAARYSDTHGFHLDNYREIWPYRDWVVNAFNQNQRYDTFIVDQIAGDLLADPTDAQLVATGFNRCNPTTSEGGAINEEYEAIYAKNRAETVSTVFLGLSMGCAACHDHKFDPLSQKDFYQFSAFFNNVNGPIMDGNARDSKPNIVFPLPEHKADWAQLQPEVEQVRKTIDKLKKEGEERFNDWLVSKTPGIPDELAAENLVAYLTFNDKSAKAAPTIEKGDADQIGDFRADLPFTLYASFKIPEKTSQTEYPVLSRFDGERGWRLVVFKEADELSDRLQARFELISSLAENALISVSSRYEREELAFGKTVNIMIAYDGSGRAQGVQIKSNKRDQIDYTARIDNLDDEFRSSAPLSFGDSQNPIQFKSLKIYDRQLFPYEIDHINSLDEYRKSLAETDGSLEKKKLRFLKDYYFDLVDPDTSALTRQIASQEIRYDEIYNRATVSLVMEEKKEPAFAYVLERGVYDKRGEKVSPGVPAALGPLPEGAPLNRLALARWLTDTENPLTARVIVNRAWQHLFGTGIVKTSEDFGAIGENPTHPELLDWLAVSFQESGWDYKALIKEIVLSETYRQDSRIKPEELAIDPENRYLARGARYRLDGETIRDQALFVSASLNAEQGGPPVKPYQPKGIWNAVAYSGSNTRFYQEDNGPALYRRSVYTFWKRTAPPPSMTIFDAPSREDCSVRRERTNTPLQALTLMNDPQFVEASRHLAQRALEPDGLSSSQRIADMYRYAFGITPPEKHLEVLADSYAQFKDAFAAKPKDAGLLIKTGASTPRQTADAVELASLTMVASQIMNLDSFINKY